MKLKRIRKVEYNADGVAIIGEADNLFYSYFIDADDWFCIDEEEYTPSKRKAREEEKHRKLIKQYAKPINTITK